MVDEAVFASALEIWEYQRLDPDEVLERARDAIKHCALLNENDALAALKESAAIHLEWSQKIKQELDEFLRDFTSTTGRPASVPVTRSLVGWQGFSLPLRP